jgi:hypothetical protein
MDGHTKQTREIKNFQAVRLSGCCLVSIPSRELAFDFGHNRRNSVAVSERGGNRSGNNNGRLCEAGEKLTERTSESEKKAGRETYWPIIMIKSMEIDSAGRI